MNNQPGAMRRGGGRYSNRSGPYDRRGGNHRAGHNANVTNQGRLSPVRGMSNIFGPGGRLPAVGGGMPYVPHGHPAAAMLPPGAGAAGGPGGGGGPGSALDAGSGQQAMMGPREAVQGRSLKSYEDLDAVGGSGGGELNY
jgi:hypothetical protein